MYAVDLRGRGETLVQVGVPASSESSARWSAFPVTCAPCRATRTIHRVAERSPCRLERVKQAGVRSLVRTACEYRNVAASARA
jgi:hypothetical protein